MAQALLMVHDRDPKDVLLDELKDYLDLVQPVGAGVMVAVYQRPEKTVGNILLPDKYRGEDVYQGKVGLVLAMGPIAFSEDASHRFGERIPQVGDWIVYSVGETFSFELGKVRCRMVEDVSVRAIVQQPDIIY